MLAEYWIKLLPAATLKIGQMLSISIWPTFGQIFLEFGQLFAKMNWLNRWPNLIWPIFGQGFNCSERRRVVARMVWTRGQGQVREGMMMGVGRGDHNILLKDY